MKKRFLLLMAALMLTGCASNSDVNSTTQAPESSQTEASSQTVEQTTQDLPEETTVEETTVEATSEEETTVEETTMEETTEESTEPVTEAPTEPPLPEGTIYFNIGREISQKVSEINANTYAKPESCVYDVFRDGYTVAEVYAMIESYAFPDAQYAGSIKLPDDMKEYILINRNLVNLITETAITPKYGLIKTEADVRTYPTAVGLTKEPIDVTSFESNTQFDYMQESTFLAGEAICILYTSMDGHYVFAVGQDYFGWVSVDDYIEVSKEMAYCFMNTDSFAIVRSAFIYDEETDYYMSMGTTLPYVYDFSAMLLPSDDIMSGYLYMYAGKLVFTKTKVEGVENLGVRKIATNFANASVGYIDYSADNIESLAKELVGCEFSWGGHGLGYDCSAVARNIYRCFGIVLPRNSSSMSNIGMDVVDLSGMTDTQKRSEILSMPRGTILLMPGHVMVYVGRAKIIHAIVGYIGVDDKEYHNFSVVNTSIDINTLNGKTLLSQLTYAVCPVF